MKTYSVKKSEIARKWYVVDADGMVLGRLASEVAKILKGKNKPFYTPHMDVGDHVIVVNADKVRVTGGKERKKIYYRHSGYPGGLKETPLKDVLQRNPEKVVRNAVKGMMPKNRLGRAMMRKLHVYAGPRHPHQAQKPEKLTPGG
jgi:large subunit ribosomal protein L13